MDILNTSMRFCYVIISLPSFPLGISTHLSSCTMFSATHGPDLSIHAWFMFVSEGHSGCRIDRLTVGVDQQDTFCISYKGLLVAASVCIGDYSVQEN